LLHRLLTSLTLLLEIWTEIQVLKACNMVTAISGCIRILSIVNHISITSMFFMKFEMRHSFEIASSSIFSYIVNIRKDVFLVQVMNYITSMPII